MKVEIKYAEFNDFYNNTGDVEVAVTVTKARGAELNLKCRFTCFNRKTLLLEGSELLADSVRVQAEEKLWEYISEHYEGARRLPEVKAWPETCKGYEPEQFGIMVDVGGKARKAWFSTKEVEGVGKCLSWFHLEDCKSTKLHTAARKSVINELNKTGWNIKN